MARKLVVLSVVAALSAAALLAVRYWSQQQRVTQLLALAEAARRVGTEAEDPARARAKFEEAQRYAVEVLAIDPKSAPARQIAGESSMVLEQPDEAIRWFTPLMSGSDTYAVDALCAVGNIEFNRGRASEAERLFLRALELDPQRVFAKQRLVYLWTVQACRWRSRPLRLELVKADRFSTDDLLFLGNPLALIDSPALKQIQEVDLKNPLPDLALAKLAHRKDEMEKALRILRRVVQDHPELIDAHAALGNALLENPDARQLTDWHKNLPPGADDHPDVWRVRGIWAQQQGDYPAAARCFWETVRREPNDVVANYQLSVALKACDRAADAVPFQERARDLEKLVKAVNRCLGERRGLQAMSQAGEMCERLGRLWEAWGWYRYILLEYPDQQWAAVARDRVARRLSDTLPQIAPEADVAAALDLADYPLPKFQDAAPAPQIADQADDRAIRFREVAAEVGIDFSYFNSDDPQTEGRRMFEFTGGGAAVLDYDQDGWPDIYLTQGAVWPVREDRPTHRDRLYRNLGNGRFRDVTEETGLGDARFSQGAAAGDFNNDGFPDLYLANVGDNRLYRNNGDGTFSDIATDAGILGPRWTTSCLVADLNGDALPDLFEVNYLEGENLFDLICDRGGRARSCSPEAFPAQHDRVFLNLGDGRFQDVSLEAGILVPFGKGLGLVAADLDGSGKLSVFVANDTTENFFFRNAGTPGSALKFQEQGILSGLAYDRDGRSQACMGVAADDADGDGLVDLFVTNFYRESNTLYRQQAGGFFLDHSRERHLREPSLQLLGFGTQFLDADLDGRPDLIVTNGHVDDFSHNDQPFQMRPQFHRNLGTQFAELRGNTLGEFFDRELLGRGMAKLDWNRDGLEEVVISHLDAPVAVLLNQTERPGHYLAIQLCGTTSPRVPIGAQVRVETPAGTQVKQLTAGDGYHASNQRQLIVGLGDATEVERVTVRWPSGAETVVERPPIDGQLKIIEGGTAWTLPQ